jgi:HD-GYP domain-containing protein (c-di-GMP phosphodiesterase class II)
MDGTLKGLIKMVAETGFDVLDALTPAPEGDLEIEEISEKAGPDPILCGGLPGPHFTPRVSDKEFDEISFSIFSAFKDIVESFYKIQDYNKLRGKFTKELALSLIHILEFHDEYTTGHSENVAILASDFAEYLDLDKNMISQSYWAGLVHDIGKIVVPSYILNKEGKLTKQEYEVIKNHPKWAYETLKRSKQLSQIAEYVLYHHERWDGNGYPQGIKGESIPLASQILSICDSWDAMRTNRSYRDALTYNQAIDELENNKDKQHSGELVNKFIKMLDSENNILFSHK